MLRPNQTLISFLLQKTTTPKGLRANDASKKTYQLCDYCVSKMRMTREETIPKPPAYDPLSPNLDQNPSWTQERRTDSKEGRQFQPDDHFDESTQDRPVASSPILGNISRNGRRTLLSASDSKQTRRCTCRRDMDQISSFQKLGISSFDKTASGNKSVQGPINALKSTSVSKLNQHSKKKTVESTNSKKERDVFLNDFIDIRIDIPELADVSETSNLRRLPQSEDTAPIGVAGCSRVRVMQAANNVDGASESARFVCRAPESTEESCLHRQKGKEAHNMQGWEDSTTQAVQQQPKQTPGLLVVDNLLGPENGTSNLQAIGQTLQKPSADEMLDKTSTMTRCRVCESPANTFVQYTLCCDTALCFRCWDKFYVPHVQDFRCCPYC